VLMNYDKAEFSCTKTTYWMNVHKNSVHPTWHITFLQKTLSLFRHYTYWYKHAWWHPVCYSYRQKHTWWLLVCYSYWQRCTWWLPVCYTYRQKHAWWIPVCYTYRHQHAWRLPVCSTAAKEAHNKHKQSHCEENV
jgi:hypothetical protein